MELADGKTALIIAGISAVGGLVYINKDKLFKKNTVGNGNYSPSVNTSVETGSTGSNTSYNTGTSTSTSGSFPLVKKRGVQANVAELQTALNEHYGTNLTVDGLFGGTTEEALFSIFGVKTVSEDLFDDITGGTVTKDVNVQNPDISRKQSSDQAIVSLADKIYNDIVGLNFSHNDSIYKEALKLSTDKLIELNQQYKFMHGQALYYALKFELAGVTTGMTTLMVKLFENKIF